MPLKSFHVIIINLCRAEKVVERKAFISSRSSEKAKISMVTIKNSLGFTNFAICFSWPGTKDELSSGAEFLFEESS